MNQNTFNYIFLLLLIALVVLFGLGECNKPDSVTLQRDSSLQIKVDSLLKLIHPIDSAVQVNNILLAQKEFEVNIIKNYYTQKQNEIITEPIDNKRINNMLNWLDSFYARKTR